eukprot:5306085-Pyramimonas_sp.AAC.1
MRGDSLYPAREPIAGGETVYTQHKNQSQEGRQYIPSMRTNRRRGDSIYPAAKLPVKTSRLPSRTAGLITAVSPGGDRDEGRVPRR